MSWVLERRLRDAEDHELVELTEKLRFLLESGSELTEGDQREQYEARLVDALEEINRRIELTLF